MLETTQTLILGASYEPLARVGWRRAMVLWASGRVEVLEDHRAVFVRTVRRRFSLPSVVRYVRPHRRYVPQVRFSKDNVFLRDRGRCQYCSCELSRRQATYDHVFPRSRGGRSRWENIVLACGPCNQRKGNSTPEEAEMLLTRKPGRPRSLPGIMRPVLSYEVGMPEGWRPYLGG